MYKLNKLKEAVDEKIFAVTDGLNIKVDITPRRVDINYIVKLEILDRLDGFKAVDYKEAIERLGCLTEEGVLTVRECISILTLIYMTEMKNCEIKEYGTIKLLNNSGDFSLIRPPEIAATIGYFRERIVMR